MNADAAKWLADYDKIIDFASLGLTGKEFVLAYDINNIAMYEKLVRSSKSILIMDDEDFFARWQKKLEIDALLKKNEDVPTLVVCDTVAKAIVELKKGGTNRVVGLLIEGKPDEFCKAFVNEWEKNKMKKFDLVVGNPPYQLGKETRVDLKIHKILQETLKDAGRIVFVHPAGFFLSHKYGVSPKNPIDTTKLESIHMFWANGIFNIGSFTPLCVTSWNKAKTNDIVSVVDDAYTYSTYDCKSNKIHIYGAKNYTWFCKWLDENVDCSTAISAKAISPKNQDKVKLPYAFEHSTLRGHPANGNEVRFDDDFFTIIPKETDKVESHFLKNGDEVKYNNVFEFNTEDERSNFINYLKTKSVRFILSLSKVDKNLLYGELNQIPWMNFTRSYSDKELRKMWNIDDKLWKFIDEHIPAYYPDWHFDGIY